MGVYIISRLGERIEALAETGDVDMGLFNPGH